MLYDVIADAIGGVDGVMRSMAVRVGIAVANMGSEPMTIDDVRRGQRAVTAIMTPIYGQNRAKVSSGAMFAEIVKSKDVAIADATLSAGGILDREMREQFPTRWPVVRAALVAENEPIALTMLSANGPVPKAERLRRSFHLRTNQSWVPGERYTLSDRVWSMRTKHRVMIDRALRDGVRRGDGPVTVARRIERYLNPDYAPLRYGRDGRVTRVRSVRGGEGVNTARRLARTEVQFMHHRATAAWIDELGIGGVKWQLSPAHPRIDICDTLARRSSRGYPPGVYTPSEFPHVPHPNCVVGDTRVDGPSVLETFERWYEGDLIEIVTVSGHRLSITPNHPVLTEQGWVLAGQLEVGQKIVTDGDRIERTVSGGVPDDEHAVPTIKEVTEAFSRSSGVTSVSVPSSAEQFHGDGFVDENVDVVWSYGGLLADGVFGSMESHGDDVFSRTNPHLELLSSLGYFGPVFDGLGPSPDSVMGGFGHPGSVLFGHDGEATALGVWPPDDVDIVLLEDAGDDPSADAVLLGESVDGPSARVCGHDVPGLGVDVVSSIVRRHFAGHVYNLHTDEEWYTANGIIVHNCLCASVPWMPSPDRVIDILMERYGL